MALLKFKNIWTEDVQVNLSGVEDFFTVRVDRVAELL